MTIKLGIIGISEGNGHPFSFSAIINGYDNAGLANSGWSVIYDYVRRRDQSEFGIADVRVTHAWTQDSKVTRKLCDACCIPNLVSSPDEMIGKVDAVIIARDDYENHFTMAMPFLKDGMHVFVDKPLSLDVDELRSFLPYLESGKLMSCSGMRYAKELDEPRANLAEYGKIRLVRGAVLNSWEKYGVHLLDGIFHTTKKQPVSVVALESSHLSISVQMDDGSLLQLDALGEVPKCFRIDIFGDRKISFHEISDNFSMFRRTLWHFCQSINNGRPAIDPQQTLDIMRLLIAGKLAQLEKRKVFLNEIQI